MALKFPSLKLSISELQTRAWTSPEVPMRKRQHKAQGKAHSQTSGTGKKGPS